jgi:hypothetical protein
MELSALKTGVQLSLGSADKDTAQLMIIAMRLAEMADLAEAKGNTDTAFFLRNNCPISPSFLREEQVLQNAVSSYQYTFAAQQPAAFERTLSVNDVFFATEVKVCVTRRATARIGSGWDFNYPDQTIFAATGEAEGINTVLSSSVLKATFNNDLVLPYWDVARCKHARPYQGSSFDANNVIVYDVVTATPTQNIPITAGMGNDGFVSLPQIPMISGKNTNKFEISFPSYTGIQVAGPTDTTNRLTLEFRGFIISGAARPMTM